MNQKTPKNEKRGHYSRFPCAGQGGTFNPIDLQQFMDAIPFYVMLVDGNHKVLMSNKAIIRDLGRNPDQILGEYCPKTVHGLDAPYPGCPLEEALEKGLNVEREFFDPQTDRWVNAAIYSTGWKTREGAEIFVHFITDITERKAAEEEIKRNLDIQSAITGILRLSLEDSPIEELLERVLDLILSIPWLSVESKGSIFLVEKDPLHLVMNTQRGLSESLQKECARVPFGRCLCGLAASSGETQFSEGIDHRHEIRYEGMSPHGHYCVPITFAGTILGVINLYLAEGHVPDQREKDLLTAVAHSLAGLIQRKQMDQALKDREEELEIKTRNLEEMNSALKILLKRKEEDKGELEEKVLFNVRELVVQYLEKLKTGGLNNRQRGLVDVLESNLNNIISPFSRTLSFNYFNFTPVEIQVADLVRQGKTTKEIAEFFNLSTRTVEFHRQNMRKKLGLKNKRANLRSSLLSLQ